MGSGIVEGSGLGAGGLGTGSGIYAHIFPCRIDSNGHKVTALPNRLDEARWVGWRSLDFVWRVLWRSPQSGCCEGISSLPR
jgi:hypothetical protein